MKSQTPLLNLFCNEDISSLSADSTDKDESLDFYSVSESDCDYFEMSLSKETNFGVDPDKYQLKKWSNSNITRLEALKWVLQTRVLFGYHYRTAYLSLLYYDRFLAKKWFYDDKPMWTGRILSIACLSLAAKMEEQKARSFTEYRVDGYNFEGIAIQIMELCVLSTLGWKMIVITPFTYLNYFVHKFCVKKSGQPEIVTQAADLILVILGEINVAEIRPSIVAAASVLAAYDRHLDRTMLDNKIDAIPTWGLKEKEQIISCYCLLQEILILKTPKSIIPCWNTHGGGSKRRLNFDDDDQCCPVKKNFLQ